eukprot:1783712-Pleurochrysis_carterae.AAC.1
MASEAQMGAARRKHELKDAIMHQETVPRQEDARGVHTARARRAHTVGLNRLGHELVTRRIFDEIDE